MSSSGNDAVVPEAVIQAYKGLFIGDAVAMPVHWYYDVPAIKRDYNGWISQYEKPSDAHPHSFLTLPTKAGDGSDPPPVIGHVILHDKLDAWSGAPEKSNHLHQGMQAGDNTLNNHCALQAMKTLRKCEPSLSDTEVTKRILCDYVKFMTTPGTHNDTFASTWHRKFFADWIIAGKPTDSDELYKFLTERSKRLLVAMPDDPGLVEIGSFVSPTPIILHNIHKPVEEVIKIAEEFYSRTHPVEGIVEPIKSYIRILHSVVRGGSLRDEAEKELIKHLGEGGSEMVKNFDKLVEEATDKLAAFQKIANELGLACNTKGSYAVTLYIARHFHDDFEGGILTNVNVGGENSHRGSPLGALLGASAGASGTGIPSKWIDGLRLNSAIDEVLAEKTE